MGRFFSVCVLLTTGRWNRTEKYVEMRVFLKLKLTNYRDAFWDYWKLYFCDYTHYSQMRLLSKLLLATTQEYTRFNDDLAHGNVNKKYILACPYAYLKI